MNNATSQDVLSLFTLCDQRGDISSVLRDARAESGTRSDALVFAWLLDLPSGIDPARAARAVLTVDGQRSHGRRSDRQLRLLRELRAIADGHRTHSSIPGRRKADWSALLPKRYHQRRTGQR